MNMMCMPVYPGAPWLPMFEGTEGESKYREWREQIKGLLGTQETTEAKKVGILMNTLKGEAKRQVSVVAEEDRNTVNKILLYLDELYKTSLTASQARSQFYSCTQRAGESTTGFILRLRELFCGLQRLDPDTAPSTAMLREQLIQGLAEGPLQLALRTYARRNPEEDFLALREEALSLEKEHLSTHQTEIACHAVNPAPFSTQPPNWREDLKKEIMGEVKAQVQGLTQELMREIRPLLQPAGTRTRARTPSPERRPQRSSYRQVTSQPNYEWDSAGRPICCQCRRAGHIARFCRREQPQLN